MNILREAVDILKIHGRTEAILYNSDTGAYCPVGAIGEVLGCEVKRDIWSADGENDVYGRVAKSEEGKFLADFLIKEGHYVLDLDDEEEGWTPSPDSVIYEWNDTSLEQTVLTVMEEAAEAYELQLDKS